MHATGVHFLLVRFIVFIKNALKENTMNLESQDKKEFVIDTKVTLQTEGTMQGQLVECGGEFVLPDYMPVIQKVLRLEAKVLMPSAGIRIIIPSDAIRIISSSSLTDVTAAMSPYFSTW